MSFGYVDLNLSAKIAVQIKTFNEQIIDPPLNEIERAICDYIQENVNYPIFKNYSPDEQTENGSWVSIFVTSDFKEIQDFLIENASGLKYYRVIHARISCRNDGYQIAG